jgi:predicted dithiol-disulfide oxidoreductase (DUF899 family)
MATASVSKQNSKVVSHAKWVAASKQFLAKEKEFSHLRDEISRQRQDLPWEKVQKNYVFEGPNGNVSLADLFGNKSQLIVYHFMFGPEWSEGCPGCSFLGDHFDGGLAHLAARDVAFVAISRAPLAKLEAFKKRMGWNFNWVSSNTSDFNFDYNVSFTPEQIAKSEGTYNFEPKKGKEEELPGASCFYKDEAGNIYHTYSSFGRGLDQMINTYNWLDIAPKGRDEANIKPPMSWVRHHDKYPEAVLAGSTCCHHE